MIQRNKKLIKLIITILIATAQVSSIFFFLEFRANLLNIVLVLVFPLMYLDYSFVTKIVTNKSSIREVLSLFVLSVLTFVSLFYKNLYFIERGYILSALGIISLIFVIIYQLQLLLDTVTWQTSKSKGNWLKYLVLFVIPASVYGVFLAACYPGLISPDSMYILDMAMGSGPFNNLHPLVYTLFIRLLCAIGLDMGGIMILQCVMCALCYSYIAYTFHRLGLRFIYCLFGIIALTLYPMNLYNTITFWKDIPYTIGLAIIAIELVKMALDGDNLYFKSVKNICILSLATLLTLFSRHNGVLTVALVYLSAFILFAIVRNKRYTIGFAVFLLSAIALNYGVLYGSMALLGDQYREPTDNQVTQTSQYALRIQGLVSVYANKGSELTDQEIAYIDRYLLLDEVDEHLSKYDAKWPYTSRTKAYCDTQQLLDYDGIVNTDFNSGYIQLLKKYPHEIINAYTKTTAIIWATPNMGYTMHAAYPFDYIDTSEYDNISIRAKSYIPQLKQWTQRFYENRASESYYALLWRPAVFMLAILLLVYYGRRRGLPMTFLIASPAIFNSLGYLIIIEAQDARYAYINMTIALILLGYTTIESVNKSNNQTSSQSNNSNDCIERHE